MKLSLFTVTMIYVAIQTFKYWLEYLNVTHAHRHSGIIPPDFERALDRDLLAKMAVYLVEKTRFGMVASILSSCAILLFLLLGVFDWYNNRIAFLGLSSLLSGWIFFL